MNKDQNGNMAKRKECAVTEADTKKLKQALKAKISRVKPRAKTKYAGMSNNVIYSLVAI